MTTTVAIAAAADSTAKWILSPGGRLRRGCNPKELAESYDVGLATISRLG
jgi:hypothetical protein